MWLLWMFPLSNIQILKCLYFLFYSGGAISIEQLGLRYPLRNRLKLLKKQSSVSPHLAGREGSKIPVPIKKRRVDTGEECSNPEEPPTATSSSSDGALEQLPPLIRKKPIAVPIKKRQELRQSSTPGMFPSRSCIIVII